MCQHSFECTFHIRPKSNIHAASCKTLFVIFGDILCLNGTLYFAPSLSFKRPFHSFSTFDETSLDHLLTIVARRMTGHPLKCIAKPNQFNQVSWYQPVPICTWFVFQRWQWHAQIARTMTKILMITSQTAKTMIRLQRSPVHIPLQVNHDKQQLVENDSFAGGKARTCHQHWRSTCVAVPLHSDGALCDLVHQGETISCGQTKLVVTRLEPRHGWWASCVKSGDAIVECIISPSGPQLLFVVCMKTNISEEVHRKFFKVWVSNMILEHHQQ